MQFRPEMVEAILSGRKTQTRRPRLVDDVWEQPGMAGPIRAVFRNGRLKWRVGGTYSVQPGRGKWAVGWISIDRIRREQAWRISAEDARAEGLATQAEFRRLWSEMYAGEHLKCWVLAFRLVPPPSWASAPRPAPGQADPPARSADSPGSMGVLAPAAVLRKWSTAAVGLRQFLSLAGKPDGIEAMALECYDALSTALEEHHD